MFGLIQSAMRTVRVAEYYFPSIKKLSDKLMNAYTNTITPETWTEKVADVDTSDMSYADKLEARKLAEQYAGLATGQCDNLAQAIQDDPASWGKYLQEKGVDGEKLSEIEAKVQQEGQIPPLELVKLTLDGTPIDDVQQAAKDTVNELVSGTSAETPSEGDSIPVAEDGTAVASGNPNDWKAKAAENLVSGIAGVMETGMDYQA